MAMLAEPRRRKRYNLCPRGKALYEDDTRFGTKMLEKMGWSKGRGLGPKEDGSQEFVRVRFKNDAEGLGYEMRDDQWTEHEEGFNGLLKALNGGDTNGEHANPANDDASASEEETRPMGFGFKSSAADEEVKPKTLKENISGVSLEEKSKYSKARVHYKKFTRGKDLAQYSEKDLANIFGKKVNEDNAVSVEVVPAEQPEEEEKPVNPNFAGVQTVITGLSVNDYFKQKMDAMKNRLLNGAASKITETNPLLNEPEDQTEAVTANGNKEDVPPKKKKKKDKKQEEEQPESQLPVETVARKAKNKKTKRAAEEDEAKLEKAAIETEENNPHKRKKKKRDNQEKAEDLIATPDQTNAEPKKKKKSRKIEETVETESPKKKNKKSKKGVKEEPTVEPELKEATAPKSKKKCKKTVEQSLNDVEDLTQEDQPTAKGEQPAQLMAKEKKKKKTKEHKSEVSANSADIVCSSDDSDSAAEADAEAHKFLTMEQLIQKQDSFNDFKISSFCAEKFHVLNMNAFKNSSLAQITGYAFDDNIKLNIVEAKDDAQRITDLWEGTQSKYTRSFKTRYRRLNTKDIKKIKRIKAFAGI